MAFYRPKSKETSAFPKSYPLRNQAIGDEIGDMKTMCIIRFIAVLMVSGFIFLIASIAGASPSDTQYSVTYDPIGETMSLTNYNVSTVDLEFWSQRGPNAFQPFYLTPGGSAIIDALGDIIATGLGNGDPTNSKGAGKTWTVTGPALVLYNWDSKTETYKDSRAVPPGAPTDFAGPIEVRTSGTDKCNVTGCDFTLGESTIADFGTIGDFSQVIPGWPGDPADLCVDLGQGTIQSIDDSGNATSIITVLGGTECIPEPAACVLIGVGGAALLLFRKWVTH